jgi:hypothetical protein
METTINVVNLRKEIDALRSTFGTMQTRQFPFAWRWAAEATMKEAQHAVQGNIRRKFRASDAGLKFLLNQVRVMGPNSRMAFGAGGQGRHAIGVVPTPDKGYLAGFSRYRRSLLPMMEDGGPTPGPKEFGRKLGGQQDFGRYGIPVVRYGVRPRLDLKLFPINLGMSPRQSIDGSATPGSLRGQHRTYMVAASSGHAMIFQRYGKERDATTHLFWTQRETRLPARKYFFATARAEIVKWMSQHLKGAMEQAMFGRGKYMGGW